MPRSDRNSARYPRERRDESAYEPRPAAKNRGRGGFYAFMVVFAAALILFIAADRSGAFQALAPAASGAAGTAPAAGAPASAQDAPVITEVMTGNNGAVTTADGRFCDWIELYNPTDKALNLAGYALSDNLKRPAKSVLPNRTLQPGEYALVFADGGKSTAEELHAAFKLSAAGTVLTLVNPGGALVQRVDCPELPGNVSYAVGADGQWAEAREFTPGFANTADGRTAYLKTRVAAAPVAIDEVMPGNTLSVKDEDGNYSDWVEITNTSDKPVDISGWGLSDKEGEPKRWTFPKLSIEPGKYIVVFLSGKNRAEAGKELHADFKLDAANDTVLLSNLLGQTVSSVKAVGLGSDESWALSPGTDKWRASSHPTPGYPNNEDGWNALQAKLYADTDSPVVISEVMSGNASTLKDQFGEYPDWIELMNRSDKSVSLKGYGLTDKSDELGRWQFPDISLGAGQRLVVFASSRNLKDDADKLHTDFSLGVAGGVVVLTAPGGGVADRCFMPALRVGLSYGRGKDGASFCYFSDPTPGEANGNGLPGQTPDPEFSLAAGVYAGGQTVEITNSDPNTTVYYTTNGDPPTDRSTKVTGPIQVEKPSKEIGGTVIRAVAYRNGYLPSNVVSNTYIIKNGVDIGLPVLSIAVDNDAMFDPTTGMYMKGPDVKQPVQYPFTGANFWKDMELPAHMELIEPNGAVGVSQDIGLQIAGQFSRGDAFKGLDMIARSLYGTNSMDYAIFPDQKYASYKAVVSRPGGQDVKYTGMRDVLISSLARETIPTDSSGGPSVFVQDYRTALQFVNGEFWGVTHLREKIDSNTLAQHYPGVDPAKVDILQGTGKIVKAGSNDDFMALIDYVKSHDLSNAANYKYVTDRMDIDSYINFFTLELCVGNSDYANIRMWRSPNLDNKWRWIFYDFCWTMHTSDRDDIELNIKSSKATTNGYLVRALLKNPGFKDKFLKQLAYNISVTFNTDKVLQRIDAIANTMAPYMDAEYAKWRQQSIDDGQPGYANWDKQVDKLRDYAREHPEKLKQQMKSYFNLSDAKMDELFQ